MSERKAIAVTGASGFIGSHVVTHLRREGLEVVPIARAGTSPPGADPSGGAVVDPGTPDQLADQLDARGVGVVIHLATHFVAHHRPSDVGPLIESNLAFATRVAEAARTAGCTRLINTSTAWQHLGGAAYAPVSLYAATKQAFEDILRHYADNTPMAVTTLTLFDTYGSGDRRRKLIPMLLAAESNGESLRMSSGVQLIDLVHVDDVAHAVCSAAAGTAAGGRWVVTSGRPIPVRTLIETFCQSRSSPLRVEFGAVPDRPNEMLEPWSIGEPLPGWEPTVALPEGLAALTPLEG